ncbi:MAG TPA: glutaredoxin domain-containing protein [Caulobacter sp.]|nr:glutaredoxin domain-containing protein [Caulobacter sp.]
MAHVTIYTRPFCGYCARALGLLGQKGADFTQISRADHVAAKRVVELRNHFRRRNIARGHEQPERVVHMANSFLAFRLAYAGEHIGGCDDMLALDREGKLDDLLAA